MKLTEEERKKRADRMRAMNAARKPSPAIAAKEHAQPAPPVKEETPAPELDQGDGEDWFEEFFADD
jgi:sRNA-binding protein